MRREILSGLLLGLILGALGFIRIMAWQSFAHSYGEYWVLVALVIFCPWSVLSSGDR
jgi:magnesium transporter